MQVMIIKKEKDEKPQDSNSTKSNLNYVYRNKPKW
jgi:hypothetical protein